MTVLSGADLVLPDRIVAGGTLVIEQDRIVDIRTGSSPGSSGALSFDHHHIVPGFIDVHVHGVSGFDTLDQGDPIASMSAELPRFGVTAFCPTTVACAPEALCRTLDEVRRLRHAPPSQRARVLPAHLESNFISPDYRGAQPLDCLRLPFAATRDHPLRFSAADILVEIERAGPEIAIVTMAPEIEGGLDLVRWLRARGFRVSLGHSGASYEEAVAAIELGACHAAHVFNRMPPLHHREPGLAGAVLQSEEVAAEVIADGVHLHPAVVRSIVAAKRPARVMAITDGTAASGRQNGASATLGGQRITAHDSAAFLDDGTMAGGVATMDRVFRTLIEKVGLSWIDAVTLCSTTPARELGLTGHGAIAAGAIADLVVLDREMRVVRTYVGGELAYSVGS